MTVHRLVDTLGRPLGKEQPLPPPAKGAAKAAEIVGVNAHNITITALALALAKHFVVTADDAETNAFIGYFVEQSKKMAAQTNVPALVSAAEDKTGQLAAMLLQKHIDARR
jgi:hypothetical protein